MKNFVSFKNSKIYFSDIGKGPAVLLLHGFLENTSMWQNIVPTLSKKNRIISIDLLGHGSSESLGYIHSMELMAETVETILKHLRIRKCILIGHSLGGYVALAFAERNIEKVKGICLMNSSTKKDSDERIKLRTRANKMVQGNFNNIVKMSFSNLFSKKSSLVFKDEISLALKEALKTSLQGYIAGQEGMKLRKERTEFLSKNSFKKLFIISDKDPILNFESSINEAKETSSDFVVLSGGHMSHIENKEQLTTILSDFCKQH